MIIIDFPAYDVSEDGIITRIVGCNQSKKGKVMKPWIDDEGYYKVELSNENGGKTYRIHRLIALHFIKNPDNLECVDHRNGIRTDNRIENLRWCTKQQNSMNCKGKGYTVRPNGKFRSIIIINNKRISLGTYVTEEEASKAYRDACIKYKGDFARL